LSGTRNFDKLPLCVLESVDTTLTWVLDKTPW
jgi:hypothetical protein